MKFKSHFLLALVLFGQFQVFCDYDPFNRFNDRPVYIYKEKSNYWNAFFESFLQSVGTILPYLISTWITYKYIIPKSGGSVADKAKDAGDVKFNSVAGLDSVKEEFKDVIDYIKNPKKYSAKGIRPCNGILLTGNPGNGKTLLAKAVAGECGCKFVAVSGSDFVQMYVGVGASRIRDLFNEARRNAPCIIFIDEIDTLAKRRGVGGIDSSGAREYEQTLNQLLVEMDGMSKKNLDKPVVVIGATNRVDVLDPAVLRPGRFDKKIEVPNPDLKSRKAILELYLKNKVNADDIDLEKLAKMTIGFSGADLENLINESALIASKKDSNITNEVIAEAYQKVILGGISGLQLTEKDKIRTAYHELGHALTRILSAVSANEVGTITIIPRGIALGVTYHFPKDEHVSVTKNELLTDIVSALGGRAAEDIMFKDVSTGASSDLVSAKSIADDMVKRYGMGSSFIDTDKASTQETNSILNECYEKAKNILNSNIDKLHLAAYLLLDKETIDAKDIDLYISTLSDTDKDQIISNMKNRINGIFGN